MNKDTKIQLLCYIISVILLLIAGRIERYALHYSSFDFVLKYYFIKQLLHYILFICIGILIGYVQFHKEKQKQGKWNIDGLKMAVVSVLPTFYALRVIMLVLAYKFQIPFPFIFRATLSNVFLIGETQFENIIMLIWGFILITSFKKIMNNTQSQEV